jgi:hypothetical protein
LYSKAFIHVIIEEKQKALSKLTPLKGVLNRVPASFPFTGGRRLFLVIYDRRVDSPDCKEFKLREYFIPLLMDIVKPRFKSLLAIKELQYGQKTA